MNLVNYVKKLLPSIKKERIVTTLETTETLLKSETVPVLENTIDYFKHSQPKSDFTKKLVSNYGIALHVNGRDINVMLRDLQKKTKILKNVIEEVQDAVTEVLPENITKVGMSARQATIIRSTDHLYFIVNYITVLLKTIIDSELEAIDPENEVSKKVKNYVTQNMGNFAVLISYYAGIAGKYSKEINNVPDIIIDVKKADVLRNMVGSKGNIDDKTIGFDGNPFYTLGTMFAEWQVSRYKKMEDERVMLELKLRKLREMRDRNGTSPKLEKQIEYYENRLGKIDYKLHRMEESVA